MSGGVFVVETFRETPRVTSRDRKSARFSQSGDARGDALQDVNKGNVETKQSEEEKHSNREGVLM